MSLIEGVEILEMGVVRKPTDFKTVDYLLTDLISRSCNFSIDASDLGKFLSHFDYKLPKGVWLAGGSLRRTLLGEQKIVSDFDMYFQNKQALDNFRACIIAMYGAVLTRKTDKHEEYKMGDFIVQLIYFEFYQDMTAVISMFDFTITQLITDGLTLTAAEFTLWDLGRKRLVLHKARFPIALLRRLLKYSNQGFYACTGCLASIHTALKGMDVEVEPQYID